MEQVRVSRVVIASLGDVQPGREIILRIFPTPQTEALS